MSHMERDKYAFKLILVLCKNSYSKAQVNSVSRRAVRQLFCPLTLKDLKSAIIS